MTNVTNIERPGFAGPQSTVRSARRADISFDRCHERCFRAFAGVGLTPCPTKRG